MRRLIIITTIMTASAVVGPLANADDTTTDTQGTTQTTEKGLGGGGLRNEVVGIRPQAGIMTFKDPSGQNSSRFAVGLTADLNLASSISDSMRNIYFGPSTGIIFSHLGSPDSNFFGSNSSNANQSGSNFFYIPADLKLGLNLGDNVRVAVHGGGNVTYRSVANSLNLGTSSNQDGSVWKLFPNVGGDFEFGLGRSVSVLLRPDFTLTPGDAFFTGTLGLSAPLG